VRWSEFAPDAALVAVLERPPDPGADGFDRLERIGAWERVVAWAQAAQAEEIAPFVDGAEAEAIAAARDARRDGPPGPLDTPAHAVESATAEIRLMLHLTANAAAARVMDARQLQLLPPTAAQARQGLLTWPKLRILLDATEELTAEQASRLQDEVLPTAPTRTTGQLRAAVHRFLARLVDDDHDLDARRRRRRERGRSVRVQAEPDGMATLRVVLPAAAATVCRPARARSCATACASRSG